MQGTNQHSRSDVACHCLFGSTTTEPILLYGAIELLFNAGPTNNINLVPVQLCTVWGGGGRRRRRWAQAAQMPRGLHSSQPAGVIGALLTGTAKVIAQ